ncbi:hypothetical protein Zmor_021480 [Zophobas morio]|uniref:Uncharacterized protein n=1 Tax=Zophobas morio TaxID=2755281 RepID=A0AA38I5S6_9CUCU|nr:hypothetical protein Zmor_021480 [Zophobas morio]
MNAYCTTHLIFKKEGKECRHFLRHGLRVLGGGDGGHELAFLELEDDLLGDGSGFGFGGGGGGTAFGGGRLRRCGRLLGSLLLLWLREPWAPLVAGRMWPATISAFGRLPALLLPVAGLMSSAAFDAAVVFSPAMTLGVVGGIAGSGGIGERPLVCGASPP